MSGKFEKNPRQNEALTCEMVADGENRRSSQSKTRWSDAADELMTKPRTPTACWNTTDPTAGEPLGLWPSPSPRWSRIFRVGVSPHVVEGRAKRPSCSRCKGRSNGLDWNRLQGKKEIGEEGEEKSEKEEQERRDRKIKANIF